MKLFSLNIFLPYFICCHLFAINKDSTRNEKKNLFSIEFSSSYTPKTNITWTSGTGNKTTYVGNIAPLFGSAFFYNLKCYKQIYLNVGVGFNCFTHRYTITSNLYPSLNSKEFNKYLNYNLHFQSTYYFKPISNEKKVNYFLRSGLSLVDKTTYMGRGYKTSLFSAAKKSINSSGSLSISVPITLGALIKFKSTYLSPSVTFIPMPKKEGGDLYQNGLTFTNAMGYFKINIGLMFK